MKLNNKLTIDLEVFFKTGKFDYVKLGHTKEWIINNFPNPDGFDRDFTVYENDVWLYGNIEFHFNNDVLFLIYSDYINNLSGGISLELKKWFIDNPKLRNFKDFTSLLNDYHINYSKTSSQKESNTVSLNLESGVKLGFVLEEGANEDFECYLKRCTETSQNLFTLYSFSLMVD